MPTLRLRLIHPKTALWLTAGASSLGLAAHAFEATDILAVQAGPVVLRPRVDFEETYDSNLFYRENDTVDDFITYISPGINIILGRRERNFISFDYMLRSAFYAEQDDLNALNHYFNIANQYQGDRLTITGTDRIELLDGILGAGLNFVTEQTKSTSYLDRYTVSYSSSAKTRVYLTGLHEAIDYESGSTLLDYNTLSGTLGFAYQAFPKTDFFGEVYYGQTATDPNNETTPKGPHSEFLGGFLGANGSFTAKLNGTVKVGYEARSFSDDSPSPDGPVVEASLTQQFSPKTRATLAYTRRNSVSVQSGSASYVADILTARLTQAIGTRGKWISSLMFSYESDAFDENVFANREDNLYRIGAGLTYQIQLWLRASLGYDFQNFDSNDPTLSDYDLHRVTLTLGVGY
jgi:hypothetical protein